MSLRSQPGVIPRDIVKAQPIRWDPPNDPDIELGEYVALGRTIEVFPVKIGSAESYREGKAEQTLSYTLYADHRRGVTFPLKEQDRIWLEEAGERKPDNTPDLTTAMTIDSVILHNDEGVAVLECGRTV
jgi:hypothetical protein